MKTVDRVINNIRQEEIDGKHERTYMLFDALDTLSNEHDEKDNEELNTILDRRLGWFVNEGVKEARKEILVIGGIALVVIGGWKLIKKHIRKKQKYEIKFIYKDEA